MENLQRPIKECITPINFSLQGDDTIEKALFELQGKHLEHKIIYFYVVDKENKLLGIVPTRKLLLSSPSTLIKHIMDHSVIRINCDQTLLEALEVLEKNRLLALPVVDEKGKLLGLIDIQSYMQEAYNLSDTKIRSDIFQLMGLTIQEGKKQSIFYGYRLRMPWIFCNMFGGLTCAIISRFHEEVLAKVLLLAFFIPLVLTLSESVSMQSMTQSLQTIRKPKTSKKSLLLNSLKEWKTVFLISLTSGLIIGSLSLLWGDGLKPSLTIGIGIFISVIISSFFGTITPILLHARSLDPKVASGPVVLTVADILTTLIYLTLASWWLL